jgi:CBS domain-containing protein
MFQGKRFEELKVQDVYQLVNSSPAKVQKGARIHEALAAMIDHPASRKVYVIDVEGNLAGVIKTETLLKLVGYRVGVRENTALSFGRMLQDIQRESAESVMDKVRPVTRLTPLKAALSLMVEDHVNDLPVVDDDYKLIGELVTLELFQAALALFQK